MNKKSRGRSLKLIEEKGRKGIVLAGRPYHLDQNKS